MFNRLIGMVHDYSTYEITDHCGTEMFIIIIIIIIINRYKCNKNNFFQGRQSR